MGMASAMEPPLPSATPSLTAALSARFTAADPVASSPPPATASPAPDPGLMLLVPLPGGSGGGFVGLFTLLGSNFGRKLALGLPICLLDALFRSLALRVPMGL